MRKYTLFKRKAEDRDPIWRVKVYDNAGRRKAYSAGCVRDWKQAGLSQDAKTPLTPEGRTPRFVT